MVRWLVRWMIPFYGLIYFRLVNYYDLWPHMVQYPHFRILEIPLNQFCTQWPCHSLVGGLEHVLFFPYSGHNHPNWPSYFSEGFCQPPTSSHSPCATSRSDGVSLAISSPGHQSVALLGLGSGQWYTMMCSMMGCSFSPCLLATMTTFLDHRPGIPADGRGLQPHLGGVAMEDLRWEHRGAGEGFGTWDVQRTPPWHGDIASVKMGNHHEEFVENYPILSIHGTGNFP